MRLIALTLLIVIPIIGKSQEVFTFANEPGRYGVGIRIVEQFDDSRVFPNRSITENRRPIQTVIWYPAKKGGKPMMYDDYVTLIGSVEDFSRPISTRQQLAQEDIDGKTEGKSNSQVAFARTQNTWAVPDAQSEPGSFPVVIYAPSISGDSFQNADLCEYLASYGYVVVASPALGTNRRNQALNLTDIETQAADIRFLVTYASTLQQADSSNVAVVGYSIGGMAAVFAAAQDQRITALVQLDGSVRYFNSLVRKSGYVTPDRVAIPMLYLAHRPLHDSIENQIRYKADLSGSFINDMQAADLYLFNINALDHRDFSSWFIRIRDTATFEDYSPSEVSAAYGWMARYVLEFLNAYTRQDAKGKKFLSARPEVNGVPRHLIEKSIQRQK